MILMTAIFVAVLAAALLMLAHSLRLRAANQPGAVDEATFARQRTVQVMWMVAAIPVFVFGLVGLIALTVAAAN